MDRFGQATAEPNTVTVASETTEIIYVEQAIRGDEQAFTLLYEQHFQSIFKFVSMRVGDKETAEDLTSTIFLKAWQKLSGFELRGIPFRAWLFRIARNAIIDHYRTSKKAVPLDLVNEDKLPRTKSLSDQVADSLEAEEVIRLLRQLTLDQQNVLIMRLVNGLSTTEIAQVMGKQEGAIRALQMRGLQALAKLFPKQTVR